MMSATGPGAAAAPCPDGPRGPGESELVAQYDYTDEDGKLLFQVLRFRPKAFRARRPNGRDGWLADLEGVRRVLYRLPQLVAADCVLVVEGEKDVETAERLSLPARFAATCNPFGACQWRSEYTTVLAGKTVYLCPDNDRAGRDHLLQVGLALNATAREVRVLALPPSVKDLSEWIGGGADREAFCRLLRSAETFVPPPDQHEVAPAGQPLAGAAGEIAAVYDYTDEDGTTLFQVLRFRPKAFRTRRPDGQGGWYWGPAAVRPVLYHLPEVLAASTVLVVEGEKDVETAKGLLLPAHWAVTCNPFGVCQWREQYSAILAGKVVYLCPDNDPPGRDHLLQVGLSLIDRAREIRVVALPAAVKDLSEWVEGGGNADGFAALLLASESFPYPRDQGELITGVQPLVDALGLIGKLRGVVCAPEAPLSSDHLARPQIGFLPQELAQVLPGWLGTAADGSSAVCVRGFEALAVAALQELAAETLALGERREELLARLDRLAAAEGSPR